MATAIDMERPYICKENATAGTRSAEIYMFKDEPGVYRRKNGRICGDDEVIAAGFDLKEDRKQAAMSQRKAAALADIESEFSEKSAQIEKDIEKEMDAESTEEKSDPAPVAVGEKDEFANGGVRTNANGEPRETATRRMDHQGGGVWDVIDKASEKVIKGGIDKEHAHILLVES